VGGVNRRHNSSTHLPRSVLAAGIDSYQTLLNYYYFTVCPVVAIYWWNFYHYSVMTPPPLPPFPTLPIQYVWEQYTSCVIIPSFTTATRTPPLYPLVICIAKRKKNKRCPQRVLNDLKETRLSRCSMIWLLPPHLPSVSSTGDPLRKRYNLLTREGVGEEPNHTTARNLVLYKSFNTRCLSPYVTASWDTFYNLLHYFFCNKSVSNISSLLNFGI
jgi:hypothetical protein